jgi:alkylhydroperoxidase/carboxymuconolactone decarboxylase family protein YurZ
MAGLRRVYRSNLDNIFERFGPELAELQWLSTKVTYGLFLSPTSEDTPSEPLTFPETEIIVLSSLAAQGAARETLWHLRGCLRAGFSAEDVVRPVTVHDRSHTHSRRRCNRPLK